MHRRTSSCLSFRLRTSCCLQSTTNVIIPPTPPPPHIIYAPKNIVLFVIQVKNIVLFGINNERDYPPHDLTSFMHRRTSFCLSCLIHIIKNKQQKNCKLHARISARLCLQTLAFVEARCLQRQEGATLAKREWQKRERAQWIEADCEADCKIHNDKIRNYVIHVDYPCSRKHCECLFNEVVLSSFLVHNGSENSMVFLLQLCTQLKLPFSEQNIYVWAPNTFAL